MRVSASFHHDSRRDKPSSDITRETTTNISFKPTSRRSSHHRTGHGPSARRRAPGRAPQGICPGDLGFRRPQAHSRHDAQWQHAYRGLEARGNAEKLRQVLVLLGFLGACYVSAGTSTLQKTSKPLSRSGCGPCSPETVCETNLRPPPGSGRNVVAIVTLPASRDSVGPPAIDSFSGSPLKVLMNVIVPSAFWIGSLSPVTCPAAKNTTCLPLRAVNTCRALLVSRKMLSA